MAITYYDIKSCGCYFHGEDKSQWVYCKKHNPNISKIQKQKHKPHKVKNIRYSDSNTKPVLHSEQNELLNVRFINAHKDVFKESKISTNEPKKHYYLYALYLEDEKFYIGMTSNKNPKNRINMHGGEMGARWTNKYKPLQVIDIIDVGLLTKTEVENKENDLTLAYMKTYGMQNVRGGYMTHPGFLILKTYTPGTWQDYVVGFVKLIIILSIIVTFIYFTIQQ